MTLAEDDTWRVGLNEGTRNAQVCAFTQQIVWIEHFEREYIVELMRRNKMNLSAAAREAQIDRKHLRELIRKYGVGDRT